MRSFLSVFVLVAACAPPPAVTGSTGTGEPAISLVYPPSDTTQIMLDPDGMLRFTAVVDFANFEFLPPGSDPDAPDVVEGQGHWHLVLDPSDFYAPPTDLFYEAEVPAVTPGQYRIIVQLVYNSHLEVECTGCRDALELEVVPYSDDTDGF